MSGEIKKLCEECKKIGYGICEECRPVTPPMGEEDRIVINSEQAKANKSWGVDDDHIRKMGEYIKKSFGGRSLYHLMQFLLIIESITWSMMDATRRARMRVAARINKNYQGFK